MTEVLENLDAEGRPTLRYGATIEKLRTLLLDGEALIFLGAGAAASPASPRLPTGAELSRELAEQCKLGWTGDVPLATTAFYYDSFYGRDGLNAFLQQRIGNPDIPPSATLSKLCEIVALVEKRGKPVLLVTTNYDQHFERAYRACVGRDLQRVIAYRGAEDPNKRDIDLHKGLDEGPEFWRPEKPGTYLYKMHGCISDAHGRDQGLVITEEDYINFLGNTMSHDKRKWFLAEVSRCIAMRTVLFIGYGLADWNFRVIFKATAESRQRRKHYAVQLFRPNAERAEMDKARWQSTVDFWLKKDLEIVNIEAQTFLGHLHAAIRERVDAEAALPRSGV